MDQQGTHQVDLSATECPEKRKKFVPQKNKHKKKDLFQKQKD